MKRFLLSLILSLSLVTQGYCASQWDVAQLAGTIAGADIDAYSIVNAQATDRLLFTYRQGCALVYASASTITVNAGALALPNTAGTVVRWRRNTSTVTVSWSDLDTGIKANGQTYYIYGIADTDVTTFSCLISTSATMPSTTPATVYYRRLGSFYNDANGNITQIVDDDNSGDIAYVKGQGNYYKIDSGTAATSGSYGNTVISFSFTFASAPIVIICPAVQSYSDHWESNVQSATTTSITVYTRYITSVNWIAIGQILAQ